MQPAAKTVLPLSAARLYTVRGSIRLTDCKKQHGIVDLGYKSDRQLYHRRGGHAAAQCHGDTRAETFCKSSALRAVGHFVGAGAISAAGEGGFSCLLRLRSSFRCCRLSRNCLHTVRFCRDLCLRRCRQCFDRRQPRYLRADALHRALQT